MIEHYMEEHVEYEFHEMIIRNSIREIVGGYSSI